MHKVYIIDDSLSVRKAIERALSSADCTVVGASTGRQALGEIERHEPDLVICDIVLPDVEGYEIGEFIQRNTKLAGTPLIMISGIVDDTVRERVREIGALRVLHKPFSSDELKEVVEECLAGAAEPAEEKLAEEESRPERLQDALGELAAHMRCAVLIRQDQGDRVLVGAANHGEVPSELSRLASQARKTVREMGLGALSSLALESADGAVVLCPVDEEHQLAVAFDRSVVLGKARYLGNRAAAAVQGALGVDSGSQERAAS